MTLLRPLVPILLLVSCVSTPAPVVEEASPAPVAAPAPPPPPSLPLAVQVIPSRLDASSAMARATERVSANGFKFRLDAYVEAGREEPLLGLDVSARAYATRDIKDAFDGSMSKVLCQGRVEVVYLATGPGQPGSFLRTSCHTEVLTWEAEGRCRRHAEIGCPDGGDRLVGDLALDAARSL